MDQCEPYIGHLHRARQESRRQCNRLQFDEESIYVDASGNVWERGPAKELFHQPKTPELRQFLGALSDESHHTPKRIEAPPAPASGIALFL